MSRERRDTSKTTPGSWHVRSEVHCGSLELSLCTEGGGLLAELHHPRAPNEEEYAANARLLAASPALRDACAAVLEHARRWPWTGLGDAPEVVAQLRAALALVEGGGE